ncbi:hypothetical protein HAX54_019194 [Datura stramonium]|uniref:Uncharacterized protein n=1 Tax=Datura stramonium TaxID=4076 RepID=A0ABS8UPE3_DATST|nr:hypothetical protein [Datura stramonium]
MMKGETKRGGAAGFWSFSGRWSRWCLAGDRVSKSGDILRGEKRAEGMVASGTMLNGRGEEEIQLCGWFDCLVIGRSGGGSSQRRSERRRKEGLVVFTGLLMEVREQGQPVRARTAP